MNTNEKKAEVIELLNQTNDTALIDEVYEILHPEKAIKQISSSNLPGDLKDKINKALTDYESGNYISHEEMKQKVEQWLTK